MQSTDNYNFILPDGTDKVNIQQLNENFTNIDGYLAENQTSIVNLNKQVLVGGEDTLLFKVDDNTARLDKLEANGDTGGGVTPALYVTVSGTTTVNGTTWYVEKWSNGLARCWAKYETTDFPITNAYGGYYFGDLSISFPNDVFTDTPMFVSVNAKASGDVYCAFNYKNIYETGIYMQVINALDPSTSKTISTLDLYIEVRGDCSVG